MSLNDIKMPPQLIAGLYPDTLVETEITAHETQTETEQPVMQLPRLEQAVVEQQVTQPEVTEPIVIEKNLVEIPKQELPVQKEQRHFDFLGKNKKKILILTANEKAQYLPEHELKFLTSILKACGLTTEDVAILNLKNQHADYSELQSFFQAQASLLFGLEPQKIDLPMNFPQFQLQNFNKCTYLHSPTLSEIEKEKALKMKLWACLKNLFSL
jgi:hypothetical protein